MSWELPQLIAALEIPRHIDIIHSLLFAVQLAHSCSCDREYGEHGQGHVIILGSLQTCQAGLPISLSDWHYRLTATCKGPPATRAHG